MTKQRVCMQNYGFENGFPGSLYNRGMKAKWVMQEHMAERLETALEAELARGNDTPEGYMPSIITKFITCLGEEGYDVYKDGCTRYPPSLTPHLRCTVVLGSANHSGSLLCLKTALW